MKMLALFPFSLGFLFLLNLTSVAGGDSSPLGRTTWSEWDQCKVSFAYRVKTSKVPRHTASTMG